MVEQKKSKEMDVKKMRHVDQYVTKRREVDEQINIEDIFGIEITVTSCDFLTGNKGVGGAHNEYCFIALLKDGDTTTYGFSCGGMVIVRKMREVSAANAFPVRAKFSKVNEKYFDVE